MSRPKEESRGKEGNEEREEYRSRCEDWGEIALGYVEAMKAIHDPSEKEKKPISHPG